MQKLPAPFEMLHPSAVRVLELGGEELLFRQADATIGMYFLERGEVELRRNTEAGHRLAIHHALPGETFAEASLFAERYHCDAVAIAPSRIVRFERSAVLDAFASNPAFAFAMASRFARQVQSCRRRLEILAIRNAEQRVLDAVRDGFLKADISSFAATIGLSREATYRALAELTRRGALIKTGRGRYALAKQTKRP